MSNRTPVKRLLLNASVLALLSAGAPARAQQELPLIPSAAASQAGNAMQAMQVDESALYYYAQNNQHGRVEAEIRRLRALHPQWNPPHDLYQGGTYNREQPLWDLLAAQEISAIHDEIARRTAQEPGWQPPLDLMQALDRVELRRTLIHTASVGHHGAVLEALDAYPALLDDEDLEILWIAASAYAHEGDASMAYELYDLAVRAARTPDELRGTLYKARAELPLAQVEHVLATGLSLNLNNAATAPVFADFRLDLDRDQIAASLATWRLEPNRSPALDREAMAAIESSWSNDHTRSSVGDYELLGWAFYALNEDARALALFERALSEPANLPSGSTARYGAALVLRDMGRGENALEVLAQALPGPDGRPVGSNLFVPASLSGQTTSASLDREMALYVELIGNALYGLDGAVALSSEHVERHIAYVGLLEEASGAEALGWYAYRSDQLASAAAWFAKAMDWRPSPSAAEGLVRARWRLGERADALAQMASYGVQFPQLASLRGELEAAASALSSPTPTRASPASSAVASASQAQQTGDPRRCLSLLDGISASTEATLVRAWCLMDLNRSHEAAEAFASVQSASPGRLARDARYGHALALLRQGRTFDALAIARDSDITEEQRAIVARSALADQANQAFNAGHYGDALAALDRRLRFASEPRDLTLLRAWSLLRLNALDEARALFHTLDQQLSTRETQRGLAALPQPAGQPLFGWR